MTSPTIVLRDADQADLDAITSFNEAAVPHVSSLPKQALKELGHQAKYFRVAERNGKLVGFLIGLSPEAEYQSPNFQWFRNRYPNFLYIDRIVVVSDAQRQGVGAALYDDLEDYASQFTELLACEVNTRPPNPQSLQFHRSWGFEQVGSQNTENGAKTVALLLKGIHPRSSTPQPE